MRWREYLTMQAQPAQQPQFADHDERSMDRERHLAVDSSGEDDPDEDDVHQPAND